MTDGERQELDIYIHENIMGECVHVWEWNPNPCKIAPGIPYRYSKLCSHCGEVGEELAYAYTKYSDGMYAVWNVVKKLEQQGFEIHIIIQKDYNRCKVFKFSGTLLSSSTASLLPDAICLAAKELHGKGFFPQRGVNDEDTMA